MINSKTKISKQKIQTLKTPFWTNHKTAFCEEQLDTLTTDEMFLVLRFEISQGFLLKSEKIKKIKNPKISEKIQKI